MTHNPEFDLDLMARSFNRHSFDQLTQGELRYAFESLLWAYKFKCTQLDDARNQLSEVQKNALAIVKSRVAA